MTARRAYLDYNASAPMLPEARAAMVAAMDLAANPSSVHAEGRAARRIVEDARGQVAALVGGRAENVIFTSGATEAASMLLTPDWTMGRAPLALPRLIVSAAEHPCLLNGGRYARDAITTIGVEPSGVIDLAALEEALAAHDKSAGPALVAIHAANNETGVVQPIPGIARVVKAHGGVLVVDAVQAVGRLPIYISEGYGDFLILSAHKIGGPKGVGAIVALSDLMMPVPLVTGGGQERGHRAGTENLQGIAGFGAAARAVRAWGSGETERQRRLRDAVEDALLAIAPDVVIHGRDADRLCNTVFFSIPEMKAETAQIAFDLGGISLSAGSACSSGKVGPSHVLKAMAFGGGEGALRVSVGRSTDERDIERFRHVLAAHLARRGASAAA